MTEVSSTVGWICVLGAILSWGCFSIPLKIKPVQRANVDPLIFQMYQSIAIFATSWLVLTYNKFAFTYYGIIGAAIWVPANLFSIVAIKIIGISVAVGAWSGIIILVSFLWGAVIFKDPVKNIWLTLLGLVLLIAGIVGLALCPTNPPAPEEPVQQVVEEDGEVEKEAENTVMASTDSDLALSPYVDEEGAVDAGTQPNVLTHYATNPEEIQATSVKESRKELKEPMVNIADGLVDAETGVSISTKVTLTWKEKLNNSKLYIIGMICCVFVGILGGSMMVPAKYGPDLGIVYVISFGTGVMAVTPFFFVSYYVVRSVIARKPVLPEWHFKSALLPGLISGLLWNVGNYCGTYASLSPLGLTVGYPLTQVALLVAGLNGIFIFKELSGARAIGQFVISAALLLIPGCLLLALFGKK